MKKDFSNQEEFRKLLELKCRVRKIQKIIQARINFILWLERLNKEENLK